MSDSVGIGHLEAAFLEVIAEIQFRAANKERALGIDHHAHLIRVHEDITIRGSVDQVHLVLQARASPSDDGHSQGPLRATLPLKQ